MFITVTTIGQLVKAHREKLGLTQDEFAQRMGGLTRQAVSLWEKDLRQPDEEVIAAGLNSMDLGVRDFFFDYLALRSRQLHQLVYDAACQAKA